MKRLLLFTLLLSVLIPFIVSAQAQENPALEEDQTMIYNYEASGGFFYHTGGPAFPPGLIYRKSKRVTGYKKKFYEIEFLTIKSPKEIKLPNPYVENGKPFSFGKLNTFLIFRGGVGMQHTLFGRNQHSGVEVRYLYSAGFSAGITKPIYLEILKQVQNSQFPEYSIVVERYDPEKHTIDSIYGRAAFTYGLDEMKFYPGGYAKFALSFEYGSGSTDVKTIEAGIVADYFGQHIPIMAYVDNRNLFINLYVALTWGGKW
jgi:hypothetical protein